MAIPPPPYDDINGIYVQIDKHVDAPLFENDPYNEGQAPQDGNVRPGQLIVNTTTYDLYVGNDSGNVRLIGPSLTQCSLPGDTLTLGFNNQNQHIFIILNSTVIVPDDNHVSLPIGYAVTIVVGDGNNGYVRPQTNGFPRIYVSGQGGAYVQNSYDNIQIHQFTMATLLKTGWNTWMIAGPGLTENYC